VIVKEKFMMTLKTTTVKVIKVRDWNELVKKTYNKRYNLQQQDGCKQRQFYHIDVPADYGDFENDEIPEEVNGEIEGVRFEAWLARDKDKLGGELESDFDLDLFWHRNFYPSLDRLINDLYEKGLLDEGEYKIDIDW
jgi:hypothetical protein